MKTIVITGASRGIGLAAAREFLDKDWRVIGTYNTTPIPIDHENLVSVRLDLASADSLAGAVKEIQYATTTIDVLLNNAGINPDGNDETFLIDKIRDTFEVNLFSVIELTQKLLERMSSGAHIVNVDSNYGAMSFPIDDKSAPGYRMSKAALNMFTRVLAFHLADRGIIVSSFNPGWVKTDMGYSVASETEAPTRESETVAQEIYQLAATVVGSGHFWYLGKQQEW